MPHSASKFTDRDPSPHGNDPLEATFGLIFVPPAECVRPGQEGLQWRKRPYPPTGEDQFLVMAGEALLAATGNPCLASGFTPMHAALMAERHLTHHLRTPESFQPELIGCTFDLDREAPGPITIHRCRDANGRVIGRGEGKALAAEAAVLRRISLLDAGQMTLEQFAGACATAKVRAGHGRTEAATIFDGTLDAAEPLRHLLRQIYDMAPSLQLSDEDKGAFVRRLVPAIMNSVRFEGDGVHHVIRVKDEAEPLAFHLVMHSDRILASEAITISHREAVRNFTERCKVVDHDAVAVAEAETEFDRPASPAP